MEMTSRRSFLSLVPVVSSAALLAPGAVFAQAPANGAARPPGGFGARAAPVPPVPSGTRATGDQQREYVFSPTGQKIPYRLYVPKSWNGKDSLPIILFLHGAGANERTYLDMNDGQMMKLAEQHGYILVSVLGFTAMGAYGNPLRLPAVWGADPEIAAKQRAAVTPERRRELALSELEVITTLEVVTEEYGADRARTFLAGHSMGSGGTWHLAARWPDRWAAVAPMSGPFMDKSYPFETLRNLPIFMTEGTAAEASLAGSRALDKYLKANHFSKYEYMEVDGNHGTMIPMVLPSIFDFFDRVARSGSKP
jgi:predicted peptidase